ncbi:Glutathione S-transferase omega-1 [Smittium culicis]|uniref:Glutathione S-transferase omega-1 n=1 Tax=Smittium culicis TaxID=133412 RepID=A0A1R1XI24_9FUNG|nr:Glutathione S-transferase omega-1 [Smittium culicis]
MFPYSEDKISLYTAKICPFAHRAVLALKEANVPYEPVEIDLGNKPEWYTQVNPASKVPAMRLPNGEIMVESMLIVEYICEQYPEAKLMPSSAFDRYKARLLIDFYGNNMLALPYRLLGASSNEAAKNEIYATIIEKLHELNDRLVANSEEGPYFFGNHFTAADIAIIPFIERTDMAMRILGFQFEDLPGLDRYYAWKAACKARPSYSSTVASFEELNAAYKKYLK